MIAPVPRLEKLTQTQTKRETQITTESHRQRDTDRHIERDTDIGRTLTLTLQTKAERLREGQRDEDRETQTKRAESLSSRETWRDTGRDIHTHTDRHRQRDTYKCT